MTTGTKIGQIPAVPDTPTSLQMKETLNYDELMNCMRCGFCLPACPTYRETGREASSPRGRIALMKAVVDGHMEAGQQLTDQLNQCLGCRACETACPAGVQYGHLLEQAREAIETHSKYSVWVRWMRSLFFNYLLPSSPRMRMLGGLLRFYQKSGLQRLASGLGIMKLFPEHIRIMQKILPEARSTGVFHEMGVFIPAKGKRIGSVGMFRGCIMDILFTETNKNTVKLLSEAGFDIYIPDTQTCCGALQAHSGELNRAKKLAEQNIRAFKERNVDFIVSNAGGCGALLIDYGHLLKDEEEKVRQDAQWFAGRVKDVSELLLNDSHLDDFGCLPEKVTYQGSCHLRNGMNVETEPRKLLQSIKGVNYMEMVESDRCCGSAGIYNLVQPDLSMSILSEKMNHVKDTQAQTLVTSNPGCLLQMKLGIEKAGLGRQMRAVHLVDFLVEAREQTRTSTHIN